MGNMLRWPIERRWTVLGESLPRATVRTTGLVTYDACCFLGAAGLGKTFELELLAEHERALGLDVRERRLAFIASSADRLDSELDKLSAGLTRESVIYLDALDEAMVPVRTAAVNLAAWVRSRLKDHLPRLRMACRTAVWPAEVAAAIQEVYGKGMATAQLEPLSDNDVHEIVASRGIDADTFLSDVVRAGVWPLAIQPLTLDMLMRVHAQKGSLPQNRRDLFAAGVRLLAQERDERRSLRTVPQIPPHEILEGAERLACFTLLSGREAVDFGNSPSPGALGWADLSCLPGGTSMLDEERLRAIAASGLCDGDGQDRFRFAHRQFAEYLAGRRIAALLPHQARSLLSSHSDWASRVAGPLRETAAFAAMARPELAQWVAKCDPEIIGLSDVADKELRRTALLGLLDRFRSHENTDAQARRTGISYDGFRYDGVESEIRPVLKDRSPGCEDVIECAVAMLDSWRLTSMSNDLADLVLDSEAPFRVRVGAAYALERFGTGEARCRLKAFLVPSCPCDGELKGIALHCNWPENLTTPELLDALKADWKPMHIGSYESFLSELEGSGFCAENYTLEGITWAKGMMRHRNFETACNLVRRIAHRALQEIERPEITNALADLILETERVHGLSPFFAVGHRRNGELTSPDGSPPLFQNMAARRALLDATIAQITDDSSILLPVVFGTPGLVAEDDFAWLLQRATDTTRSDSQRRNYAVVASRLPWQESQPSFEIWFELRTVEPIASVIDVPLSIEIGSDSAAQARKYHAMMKRSESPARQRMIFPSPAERVRDRLDACETKDPLWFRDLCLQLTLEDTSTHYACPGSVARTPGWVAADSETRARIVSAAKRLIMAPTDEPERARSEPLNSVLIGHMHAILLIMETDPDWVTELPSEWWERWAWYMLRELRLHMYGEPDEGKIALARILHEKAAAAVSDVVVDLSAASGEDTKNLLMSLLEVLHGIVDPALDARVCECLKSGRVSEDRMASVAGFVLSRDPERAIPVCLAFLDPTRDGWTDESAVGAALALLFERPVETWDRVLALLRGRHDLAHRILAEYAHNPSRSYHIGSPSSDITCVGPARLAQLFELLIGHFPPEADPQRDGAYSVGPNDSARLMRDRLITWLGDQSTQEAVAALKRLERDLGGKWPWLRRPRARAERAYRVSQWEPISPAAVAEVLGSEMKGLIRSDADACEGVVEALNQYGQRLRHDKSSDLEDFWNLPKGGPPSPKAEERVSDKLCDVIRAYFADFSVTSDREVQVRRRLLPTGAGGVPGSEVDVIVRVPAAGSMERDDIAIPVEVKLSCNDEARTGLKVQLVDRYMSELASSVGVFVIVWMKAPGLAKSHQPIWAGMEEAREDLQKQAQAVAAAANGAVTVAVVVLDVSLPTIV